MCYSLKKSNYLSFSCFTAAAPVPFNTAGMPSSPLHHCSVGYVPDLMHPEDGYYTGKIFFCLQASLLL